MLDDREENIFLSRWLNNELTDEELADFKADPEYKHYQKLVTATDTLELTSYNMDTALHTIKSSKKTVAKSPKVIKLWSFAAIAASIAILIGVFMWHPQENFTTVVGQQMAVKLPDGSEMMLNATSTASFDKKDWENNRTVTLEGEAYFKVKKGSTFTVVTPQGEVRVLGTQFTVQAYPTLFEAICYEGKVQVSNRNQQTILTAGNAYRNINDQIIEQWDVLDTTPSWIHQASTFRSIPVQYVFDTLEKQYHITIDAKQLDSDLRYTGTFPNNALDIALKTVCSTLGMQYTISADGKTVVVEKQ